MVKRITLNDIALFSKGSQINGDDLLEDEKYDYLNGGINPSGKWSEFNVPANTIAISEGGNSCGYVNYMDKPFWCGAHCYYLYDVNCNTKYLYYALKSQQDNIMKLRSGACMPNIKKKDIGEFSFVFDDNSETQKQIAATLDKVTDLINKRKQQLEKLDELVKSRFIEMFGDVIQNDRGWQQYSFSDIASSRLGKMLDAKQQTGKCAYPYLANFNVQWFRFEVDNLNQMDFSEADRQEFELRDGDLLVCEGGEIGRCAVWHNEIQPCYFQKALHRVRCNQLMVLPNYMAWWFKYNCDHKGFAAIEGAKATIAHLPGAKLKVLKVTVPPIELQGQFAAFVEETDKLKFETKQGLEKLETLKKSLMQEYFG